MTTFAGNRPSSRFVLAVAALLAGEGAGFALPGLATVWGGVAVVLALVLIGAWGWGVRGLGWGVLAVVGLVLALRTEDGLRQVLGRNEGESGRRPAWEVRVDGDVVPLQSKKGAWRVEFPSQLGVVPVKVVLPVATTNDVPRPGEVWRVAGRLAGRGGAKRRYDRRDLWCGPAAQRVAPARTGLTWTTLADELARRAGAGLGWNEELAALNRAILLGRRTDVSGERRAAFVAAGTVHVFAISGLHVMVVALFLTVALGRLGFSLQARNLVAVPLVVGYVVLTGCRPSAVRAALMALLWLVAPAFGRRPDPFCAWSATAFLVYGLAPEKLFDLGCALSFTVMLGILLWGRWSRPLAPLGAFTPGTFPARLVGGVGVSFAAWVAGVPLAAHAFGRFTPGGLVANVVVVIVANVMVRLGLGALLASFVCLPLAALLNNAAAACTWVMATVSSLVAALPFASFDITPWSWSVCLLWYAAWIAAFHLLGRVWPKKSPEAKRWW